MGSIALSANIHYVDLNNSTPSAPYTNWASAAQVVQDAVDAADAGDLVLVTNGIYQTGGRPVNSALTNRVAITSPITVQSVNGPGVTVINGVAEYVDAPINIRCAYLADGAVLSGFTLTNGGTFLGGSNITNMTAGGIYCESTRSVVSNCVLAGNLTFNGPACVYRGTVTNCTLTNNVIAGGGAVFLSIVNNSVISHNSGGGAFYSALNDCVLSGNFPDVWGGTQGGALYSLLNNCTVVSNSSKIGGGVYQCTNNNCVIYYNSATTGPNYSGGVLNNCCTTPLPAQGTGNITQPPRFADTALENFRLQPDSPCINAGNNAYVVSATDLGGNPRIAVGTVDIGAYEFQNPASLISYAWLQQYGLPNDGSADYSDADGDGMNNWQEWRAGTIPTNSLSVLRLLSASPGDTGVLVRWQSVTNRNYWVERAADLAIPPPWVTIATNLPGQPASTAFTDTNASVGSLFYRVGVQ
jgi:hypothetical protein